eukprot:923211-Pleurochrysis_carterae.AAC.1
MTRYGGRGRQVAPAMCTSKSCAAVALSASQTMRRAQRRTRDVQGIGRGQGPGRLCGGSLARKAVDSGSGRSGKGVNAKREPKDGRLWGGTGTSETTSAS